LVFYEKVILVPLWQLSEDRFVLRELTTLEDAKERVDRRQTQEYPDVSRHTMLSKILFAVAE
jgi:hypothetical protein